MKIIQNFSISPFVKWVGGKRNVIKQHLVHYFPKSFDTYYEPFVGGGAVLLYLQPQKAVINDTNKELIIAYKIIKLNPKKLMNKLNEHILNHSKEYFYLQRQATYKNSIEIAARFIYLNKTSFNGMYRVNKNNKFNVPFNNKTKNQLNLYEEENIKNLSKFLNSKNIQIFNKDFEKIVLKAKENDFVFCDPPYDYDTKIGFDSYSKNAFGKQGQIRLFKTLDLLDKKGVKWMLTNHNTKLINELYKNYKIIPIRTNRNINSNGNKRKQTGDEVIIINYEWKK